MKYQKIANLIDNSSNQIKFQTTMLKSSLWDYSDAYILVKGKITTLEQELMQQLDKQIKEIKV